MLDAFAFMFATLGALLGAVFVDGLHNTIFEPLITFFIFICGLLGLIIGMIISYDLEYNHEDDEG